MNIQRNSVVTDELIAVLTKCNLIDLSDVKTAHDIMLRLRIDWQELETRLRNKKIDGFEKVIDTLQQLAAMAIRGACFLEQKRLEALENVEPVEEPWSVKAELEVFRNERKTKVHH